MTPVRAITLGLVQGLTEWLPISSTAHLKIVPELLGWPEPGAAFSAVIQWGTLLAALLYFRHDIGCILWHWTAGLASLRPFASPEARLGWMILVGTVPIVVLGLLGKEAIETVLRRTEVIATALIAGGLLLYAAEYHYSRIAQPTTLETITWTQGLLIGVMQALALIPGASRSGVTITGGLFVGVAREAAARYSFLLSFPAIFAAGLYQLIKARHELFAAEDGALNLILATIISSVVGYVTIPFLLGIVKRHSTAIFIGYRLMMGLALFYFLYIGLVKS
ncbi:MAG: undecaprenyl-diphosphatase UppP [Gemmataceae bacterium]